MNLRERASFWFSIQVPPLTWAMCHSGLSLSCWNCPKVWPGLHPLLEQASLFHTDPLAWVILILDSLVEHN